MVEMDLVHHVVELIFEVLENHLVILLNEHRLLLRDQVGDAVEGSSKSLVEQRVHILQGGGALLGLLRGVNRLG